MGTLAIVDSRNVHGQTAHVLGVGLTPSVNGVIEGLALYGFDVTQVQVGLALARPRDQQALATEHAANDRYCKEILADSRGRALLGELHLKEVGPPRRVEEKIVDVQCALAIALSAREIADGKSQFDSIVVCSQDIDVRPALEYATGIGVPVWVAAHDVVDRRPQPHLLLTCAALAKFRPSTAPCAHERRQLIAAAALAPDVRSWTVLGPMGATSRWLLEDGDGTPARCNASALPSTPQPGDVVHLGVAGITRGSFGNDFPLVVCERVPSGAPLAVEGKVLRRLRLNKIRIEVGGTQVEVVYPPGGVLPGTRVAVEVNPTASRVAERYRVIGPVGRASATNPLKLKALAAEPVVATVTPRTLSDYRIELESPVGALVLDHPSGSRPLAGVKLAVVLADNGAYKLHPVVHAVSASLG